MYTSAHVFPSLLNGPAEKKDKMQGDAEHLNRLLPNKFNKLSNTGA